MRFGSVCSGVEAASLAWEPLGFQPQFFSEVASFQSAVLAHHWPGVPNLGDFTSIDGSQWQGKVDVLVAGTPCQAFSPAGLRRSLGDARGNLTLRFVELVHAINPRAVVWENVTGVLTTNDNAFGCFLAGLVGSDTPLVPPAGRWTRAGVVAGPQRSAAWRVLNAQYFGVAQRRRRVFVLSFGAGASSLNPGAVLFEPEVVRRDTPQVHHQGQDPGGPNGSPGGSTVAGCQPISEVVGALAPGAHPGGANGQDAYTAQLLPTRLVNGVPTAVRRLTPVEWERLQGMPDNHTRIPWQGRPVEACPDSLRFLAVGNSMAVPVMAWIGKRLKATLEGGLGQQDAGWGKP